MRVALAAVAASLVLPALVIPGAAGASSGSSGSTASAIGSTGMYRPINRIRAWDSRVSGAIPAKATAKVQVNDVGTSSASNVVAVSVNVTVLTPAVTGSITVFADGTSWSGATMTFQAGQTDQNFETVPVRANGLIDLRNNTARSLALIVDILGYYTRDTGNLGRYQPMTPTRMLDTRTGQPVAAGQTRTFGVGGRAGIPPQGSLGDRLAVAVNVTVLTPSRSGSLTVGGTDLYVETATMSFTAGQTEQGQLLELLDADGNLSIRNNSAAALQLIVDVVGYYIGVNITDTAAFDHFSVGSHYRVYDSRAGGQLPPGGTVVLPIWDLQVGNTNSGICAPLMNVTVLTPSVGGSVSAWADGAPRETAATVTFVAHQTRQRMVMISVVGNSGNAQVRNNSSAPITLIVDVKGWRNCI